MKRRFLKVSRWLPVMVVVGMLWLPAQGFGALTVTSKDIVSADGTSGQDVMAGNGVKTGHIQDGAVTTSKIIDGAVTSTKIGAGAVGTGNLADGSVTSTIILDGSVTTSKIGSGAVVTGNIADGAVNNSKIADGAVTTTKIGANAVETGNIADGAVTDAKISGIVGTDKIGTYSNVFIVHKGPANNQTTFNSVKSVFEHLFSVAQQGANWPGERQAILVMPGRYEEDLSLLNDNACSGRRDCSAPSVNVDILGASRTGSVIALMNNNIYDSPQGSMQVRSGMYLKNLTVEGVLNVSHAQNAGVIGSDVLTPWIAFYGGWENIKNFTIDDVYIDPAGNPAIGFWGTGENDTLKFNNIRINNGYIIMIYPITAKPFKFSNITYTGNSPNNTMFTAWYANSNAPSATFNFDNLSNDGNYSGVFTILNSAAVKINVTNSKLNNYSTLLSDTNPGSNEVAINNSVVSIASSPGSSVKIGNSQIGTIQPSNGAIKVVNSYNANFDSYNNGQY